MKKILALIAITSAISASAQNKIDLSGTWEFQIQRSENSVTPVSVYDDTILLPGSMVTRGKGDLVSVKTQWTGSLYDSSFYFNPYMEKYRKMAPSDQKRWAPALYRIYFNLNMGKEFEEIDRTMRNN